MNVDSNFQLSGMSKLFTNVVCYIAISNIHRYDDVERKDMSNHAE